MVCFLIGKNMALTENDIIDIIYALYETDTDGWGTGDDEYLAARKYCNVAISRWEKSRKHVQRSEHDYQSQLKCCERKPVCQV